MLEHTMYPCAIANVKGGSSVPGLRGTVKFYRKCGGVLVEANLGGLPQNSETGFFAMHIHEGVDCGGEAFANTKGHYAPGNQPHPRHAGDLPPLLGCGGKAYLAVWTDRFSVKDIIGRTVVIHRNTDDFHTQPSGNAGEKIGCGEICAMSGGQGMQFVRK